MDNRIKWEKRLDTSLTFVLIGSIVLLVFEADSLENTVGGLTLFWTTLTFGVMIGLAIAGKIFSHFASVFCDSEPLHPVVYIIAAISIGFITSAMASNVNRNLAGGMVYTTSRVVLAKYVAGNKGRSYYVEFQSGKTQYETERVKVKHALWQAVSVGDTVIFTMRQGF